MDLVLDGNGPLYLQLARALREAMAAGRLANGTRLPSSRELAYDLDLSRTTVVAAYEHLRAEGYISGRVGSGSYVTSPWTAPVRLPPPRRAVVAQSRYSQRTREVCMLGNIPGHRPPGMRYAFQFGVPMVNTALTAQWVRELARAAPYVQPNYPRIQGLPALREAVARHINRTRGVACVADDVLIVSGTQQALTLIARVLLDEGDAAALEEPHYFTARTILQAHGARLIGVPVDADGLQVEQLPDPAVKLTYVTPSHQFPTGAVLSYERRLALLEYARLGSGWIVEDDYDGEFRHDRQAVQALQQLDRDGRVLYVGSFSKTLFPALRLGYIVMPPGLRDDLLAAKWADDFGSPPLDQAALANFIASGAYDRHLRQVTRKLAERRALLRTLLEQHCGDRLELMDSHAGMHLVAWIRDMPAAEGDALIRAAHERKLALYSIAPCYLQPPDRTGLIMGFSAMSPGELRDAVALFAQCLALFPRHAGGTRRPALYLARSSG
ncbi:MocR-like pyridoxine biosynthesis transcription factor PdxR [Lysobacter terrae]